MSPFEDNRYLTKFAWVRAVRGAITVKENHADQIRQAACKLVEALIQINQIETTGIITCFFTVTPDLTALNPAKAVRTSLSNWDKVPMLCAQEPMIDDMLPRCIRVLLQWESKFETAAGIPLYLEEAATLRPDLHQ